jgi:replicative DNA helicase
MNYIRFANKKIQEPELVKLKKDSFQEYKKAHNHEECYATYAVYEENDQESAIIAPMVFDLDSEKDLELARKETIKICEHFQKNYSFMPDMFFSGSKGFHLIVPAKVFGLGFQYDPVKVYKQIVKALGKVLNLKTIDYSVLERKRIFRLNNTKHEATGLYKVRLKFNELNTSVEEIKKLAQSRRKVQKPEFVFSEIFNKGFLDTEKKLNERERQKNKYAPKTVNQVKLLPCIKKLFEKGAPSGKRNAACYTLALFLKSQNLEEDQALQILHGFSGLSDNEIQKTVNSAYKHNKQFGCNNNELIQEFCDKKKCQFGYQKLSFDDMVESNEELLKRIRENILEQKGISGITFGHEKFKKMLGNIKKEEVIIVAGDAGIGKTAYGMYFLRENLKLQNRVLYCSLEMSNDALIERTIAELSGVDSEFLGKGEVDKQLKFYKDHQHLFYFLKNDVALSSRNIKRLLEENMYGSLGLDAVVIDHLGGVSVENQKTMYEEYSRIMAELRELTKRYQIPIILLTHYNKGQTGASNKPRSVNDILGSGRIRDFATKIIQIWYQKTDEATSLAEFNDVAKPSTGETFFICQKNTYGDTKTVRLIYKNGNYFNN